MCIQTKKKADGIGATCYTTAKMILFLFLLFIQMSCGGGGGGSGTPVAAVNATITATLIGGAANVATDSVISVSFNVDMDPFTINPKSYQVSGPDGTISGTVSYDQSTRIATFTPTAPLMPQTTYTASLATDVKDKLGQELLNSFSWTFNTGKDTLSRSLADIIPTTLFGQHMHRATTTTVWPTVPFGSWRLWDAYVAWPNIEPQKGEFHFETLDRYIALAEAHGVELVLPLGLSPQWASNRPTEPSAYGSGNAAEPARMEDWKNYVKAVASRYVGRVHYYEIWNEPNIRQFYSGSVSEMILLTQAAHQIIKEVDPSAQIISPAAVGSNGVDWLDQFLSRGGGDYSDIIGFHLYVTPDAPEAMADLAAQVKTVMAENNASSKPLWNTESGWSIQNSDNSVTATGSFSKVLTNDEASAYIARAYLFNWAAGVDRFFWYAWDNGNMGSIELDGTIKPSSVAFTQIHAWLNGSTMKSCGKNKQNSWVVKLIKNNGHYAWIVWNPNKTTNFTIPKEWNVRLMKDLLGNTLDISTTTVVPIGPSPILLEN